MADRTYVARRHKPSGIEYVDSVNSEVMVVFAGFLQDKNLSAEIASSRQQLRFVVSGQRPYMTMSCLNEADEPELRFRLRRARWGRPSVPASPPNSLGVDLHIPCVEVVRPQKTFSPEMSLLTVATARRFLASAAHQTAGDPKV